MARQKDTHRSFPETLQGATKTTTKCVDNVGMGLMVERIVAQEKASCAKSATSGTILQRCTGTRQGKYTQLIKLSRAKMQTVMVYLLMQGTQGNNTKITEQANANVQVGPAKTVACFKLDTGHQCHSYTNSQIFGNTGLTRGFTLPTLWLWR